MDYKVSLSEQAELDIDQAFEWYENKKVGLGLIPTKRNPKNKLQAEDD